MPSGPSLSRRALLRGSLGLGAALAAACSSADSVGTAGAGPSSAAASPSPLPEPTATSPAPSTTSAAPVTAGPATVAARATVPVLCYHQLREWRPSDGAYARRLLVCPPAAFRRQLDALAEDGWTTITPDQYLAHLTAGAALPARPVILSFDDSQGSQVTEGLPQLVQRDMTGTFFCMTVVLDKRGWMSRDDLRRLGDAGMTVAAHSYDHNRADRYSGRDFALQFDAPRALLEKAVGRPVEHFAYPYGAWAPVDFAPLRAAGYRTAFQLSDKPLDLTAPLLTLRRVLVDSTWSRPELLQQVRTAAS